MLKIRLISRVSGLMSPGWTPPRAGRVRHNGGLLVE